MSSPATSPKGQRTFGWKRFLRRPSNLISVVFLSLVLIATLWPTSWLPHDPTESDLLLRLQPPAWLDGGSWSYVLGTDNLGRDVFSRIVLGARCIHECVEQPDY